MNNYYVYRHRRLDDFSVFYVGLGERYSYHQGGRKSFKTNYSRAHVKRGRTEYWKRIVEKHGYKIEIIADNLTKEQACELEIFLISLYGRSDLKEGRLVNNTDGGDGSIKQSPEIVQKKKDRFSGEGNPMYGRTGELSPVSIAVQEVATGDIYPSFTSAADYLGIRPSDFSSKLMNPYRTNDTGFVLVDKSLEVKKIDRKRRTQVVDFITGEVIDSLSEAARIAGISRRLLRAILKGQYFNVTNYILKEDYEKGLKPEDLYKSNKADVPVINIETNEIFPSILKTSILNSINESTLASKLRGKLFNDTPFQLLQDYQDGLKINWNYNKDRNNEKKIINKVTKEIYNSMTEASKKLGISATQLSNFLNGRKHNPTNLIFLRDYENGVFETVEKPLISKSVIDVTTGIQYPNKKKVCDEFGIDYVKFKQYMSGKKENPTQFIPMWFIEKLQQT